jgi:hypothetical protein
MNPNFFEGTVVEEQVAKLLDASAKPAPRTAASVAK